jgi:hypothetical protein
MRRQNELSDPAFGLLADLIGGQVLMFSAIESAPRRCVWNVAGKEIDPEIIRELRTVRGESLIWPESFDNLDNVPHRVTRAGYAFARNLADA